MTMQEVLHTLQHLMAQATHDTTWITATQTVLEEHAKQIDENAAKSRVLYQVVQAMKADIKMAFTAVERNDVKIKSVIEDLGALTQQSVASLDTSLREQVKAEIVDLRTALDRVGVGPATDVQLVFKLQQLEAHFVKLGRNVKLSQDKVAASIDQLGVLTRESGELARNTAAKVEHHEGQQRQRQQQRQTTEQQAQGASPTAYREPAGARAPYVHVRIDTHAPLQGAAPTGANPWPMGGGCVYTHAPL